MYVFIYFGFCGAGCEARALCVVCKARAPPPASPPVASDLILAVLTVVGYLHSLGFFSLIANDIEQFSDICWPLVCLPFHDPFRSSAHSLLGLFGFIAAKIFEFFVCVRY